MHWAGENMRQNFYDFCVQSRQMYLLEQWDEDANQPLKPTDVTHGSSKKIWWTCEKGHHWKATPCERTARHTGCPVCLGKTIITGVNDLASRYPELTSQWHPIKNDSLTPQAVSPHSNRTVWWICEKGHEYKATIASRTAQGTGCPYCANRMVLKGYNDLASQLPIVAAEWHPIKNGVLTPQDVTCGSTKKVWWKCSGCGYEWQAIIYSRAGVQRCGCPACSGKVRRL